MTNSNKSNMRQRPNAKKAKKADAKAKPTTATDSANDDDDDDDKKNEQAEPTAWETITGHWSLPFYGLTAVVLLPYMLHNLYLTACLQRPDLLSHYTGGLVQLRPPVAINETRPVLIVGTMSGGTTQVSTDLGGGKESLGLEICHETSETTRHFCRDGTVSWFHGVRFIKPETDSNRHIQQLATLCTNFTRSMGFHPRMYRDTSGCSVRTEWNQCWKKECVMLLHNEWGCAWNNHNNNKINNNGKKTCQTPFATTLLQVRHPVRTVESLVAKFCNQPQTAVDAGFVQFMQALFPTTVTKRMQTVNNDAGTNDYDDDDDDDRVLPEMTEIVADVNWSDYTCLEATTSYVLNYYRDMVKAHKAGLIRHIYQVEATSPCQVAALAGLDGFGEATSATKSGDGAFLWQGTQEKVQAACGATDDGSDNENNKLHQPMTSSAYKVNFDSVFLGKEDYSGTTELGDLWVQLQTLTAQLGYKVTKEEH